MTDRESLILDNINLARTIAWPMALRMREREGVAIEDFLQDAMEALVRLAGDFDPARDIPFDVYVKTMLPYRLLNKMRRYDRLPERRRRLVRVYWNTRAELTRELVRYPTTAEIAERMGVTAGTVRRLRQLSKTHNVSFDALTAEFGDPRRPTPRALHSNADTAAEALGNLQVAAIEEAVATLDSRDQEIVALSVAGESQHEIARRIGVSPQRVSQLVGRIRGRVAGAGGGHSDADRLRQSWA